MPDSIQTEARSFAQTKILSDRGGLKKPFRSSFGTKYLNKAVYFIGHHVEKKKKNNQPVIDKRFFGEFCPNTTTVGFTWGSIGSYNTLTISLSL